MTGSSIDPIPPEDGGAARPTIAVVVALFVLVMLLQLIVSWFNKPKMKETASSSSATELVTSVGGACNMPTFSNEGEIVGNLSGVSSEGWLEVKNQSGTIHTIHLYGLLDATDAAHSKWIMKRWGERILSCRPQGGQEKQMPIMYRCVLLDSLADQSGIDIADALLLSGKMKALPNASECYARSQAEAKEHSRGIWRNVRPNR